MARHRYKVLFFIAGTKATDKENDAIDAYGARCNVCIRNAAMIGDNDAIEDFDVVGGLVPQRYAIVAETKPPVMEAERPITAAASAPQGSPLAAPAAVEPEPAIVEPQGADAAKPKAPAPKPEAAKGWKPNA